MQAPSLLLWDWDNTLVDGWASIAASLNAAFDAFGQPRWTAAETRARVRVSLRDSFPVMFGDDWERARDIFYTAFTEQHLDHVQPMPGVEAMLRAAADLRQGVVSNKAGAFLRREVTHLGWDGYFGAVVGAGDAVQNKPSAAPILLALSGLQAAAEEAVWYIGDTALDMQAARAAGVTAVLLGDAAHDGGVAHAAPDLHFPSAQHLAQHLAGHLPGQLAERLRSRGSGGGA